jgi:serine/threonine protein kinase
MDDRVIEVTGQLGQGNFGVVWEANERDGREDSLPFALKVSTPATPENFNDAAFEVDVLRQLTQQIQDNYGKEAAAEVKCVPRYIAHQISLAPGKPGKGTVTLAMSKVDGMPLDRWLYGPKFNENRLKTISMEELLDGPLQGSQLATRGIEGAAQAVAELLRQASPVFDALEGIAFHRDVSAHNFLVTEDAGGRLNFGIIDFGLAVSSRTWKREYRTSNLAGTPNYFPPSTWMFFTQGYRYLEEHPNDGYLRQYQERLDHFAVGALAIEIFFVLWNGDGCTADTDTKFKVARTLWRNYWTRAVKLYQDFFTLGPANLRKVLQGSREVSAFAEAVHSLVLALRAAAASAPDELAGCVFDTAAALMDPKGAVAWTDIPSLLTYEATAADDLAEADNVTRLRSRTVSRIESTTTMSPTRSRTYSHRRIWTVDESLKRGVPDIGTRSVPEVIIAMADKSDESNAIADGVAGGINECRDAPSLASPEPAAISLESKHGDEHESFSLKKDKELARTTAATNRQCRHSLPLLSQCLPFLTADASSTALLNWKVRPPAVRA